MDDNKQSRSPSSVQKNAAINPCSYGEDCYRQNPKHFEEYSHPHLEDLISKMKISDTNLPPGYKQKISRRILDMQISFQRNIKKYGAASGRNNYDVSNKNSSTPIQGRIHKNSSPSSRTSSSQSSSSSNIRTLSSFVSSISSARSTSSSASPLSNSSSSNSSPSVSNSRSDNDRNAQNYRTVVMDRVKNNIADKWNDAAPYYFFLSAISDSKKTHLERLTVHFPELLDPRLGDLKASLQINFMVELGWLLAQYHIMGHKGKPMTLLYGEGDENMSRCPSHVTAVKIKCPSPFGSHHTKMSVMLYSDDSIRVIVSTGNLVESDWDNRTQGVWISPRCPPLNEDVDTGSGDSPTNFKKDLLQYLTSYKLPDLQEWVGHIRRADFSSVRVFFIASVPGTHHGLEYEYWAQGKLSYVLKRHATVKPSSAAPDWHIIAQCSSIGSLGPEPNSWMAGQMKLMFSSGQGLGFPAKDISLMYPSFENVAASHDGLLGGGCLPYSQKTHQKQLWLHKFLKQWKSDNRYRTKAMPHIKTYCRISPDHKHLSWFLLTSANLSKAAWGNSKTAGKNYVMSYEAGVLFVPKFLVEQDTFPIQKDIATKDAPLFPMPYDVPLVPYDSSDIPWFFENIG